MDDNSINNLSLHPLHKEDLKKSGLSDKTIIEAGIKSVRPGDISKLFKNAKINTEGITSIFEIPYPDTKNYSMYKIFWDTGQEHFKNGDEKPKYLKPHDAGNKLYVPSYVKPILKDVSIPLYLTEGEKKALKAAQEGIYCIALSGLWNWKIKDQELLIPDFSSIALKGRTIYIVPDNDWLIHDRNGDEKNLKQAVYRLAYLLIEQGAKVDWVELPTDKKKIGLDDYLCEHSKDDFKNLPHWPIRKDTIPEAIETLDTKDKTEKDILLRRIAGTKNNTDRATYINLLSKKINVGKTDIKKDISIINHHDKPKQSELENIIEELNKKHALVMHGGKAYVLTEKHDPTSGEKDIDLWGVTDFKTFYSNRIFNDKGIGYHWIKHPNRKEYNGIFFSPSKDIPGYYNLWKGFAVEPKEGDCQLYLDHIKNNIAEGNEEYYNYILTWLADIIQNPVDRPGICLVLRGKRGTGKSVFCGEFCKLFGQHAYQITRQCRLLSKFNSYMKNKIVVWADEAYWAGDKTAEGYLKGLITEPWLDIEYKGKEVFKVQNLVHVMISSNELWVVPAALDERRFAVFDVSEEHKQDKPYFQKILNQMNNGGREALLYYLENYKIDTDLNKIPATKALFDTKIQNMSTFERWWFKMLIDGALQYNDKGEAISWEKEVTISRQELRENYYTFADNGKERYPGDPEKFYYLLRAIVPSLKAGANVKVQDTLGKWKNAYEIPSLEECRKKFCELTKTEINWKDRDNGADEEIIPF